MKRLNNCPLCFAEAIKPYLQVEDHFLSKEVFVIHRCEACGFRFTNPRPQSEQLAAYYKSDAYIAHSNTHKGMVAKIYQWVRKRTIRKKVARLRGEELHGDLLDIGCATGEFLHAFQQHGWTVAGIEPDQDAASYARTHYGLSVYPEAQLDHLPDASFDLITMWHVLEHVEAFRQRMETVIRLLKPGGRVVIAVPNPDSYDARHYGSFWAAWDVPRHLSHFSQDDMHALCVDQLGLEARSIHPMPFDSFYVSMLSEKYRGKPLGFVRAIFVGLFSNLSAIRSGEYSSLTYVFRKSR